VPFARLSVRHVKIMYSGQQEHIYL